MPSEKTPPKTEREPKTPQQLHEEEVQKQLTRLSAGRDPRVVKAQEDAELQKHIQRTRVLRMLEGGEPPVARSSRKLRPFQAVLEQADVRHEPIEKSPTEARQDTLEIAEVAATMLAHRDVDPSVGVAIKIGSETRQELRTKVPVRRIVMRNGFRTNEAYEKTQLLGRNTTNQHRALTYGWEIPMTSKHNEIGTKLVLCEDGQILSVRGTEKAAKVVPDMHFIDGHGMDNKAFLRAPAEGQPKKSVFITDRLCYSMLDENIASDIAASELPVNNPDGAARMALSREAEIQEGIAMLLNQNGITE